MFPMGLTQWLDTIWQWYPTILDYTPEVEVLTAVTLSVALMFAAMIMCLSPRPRKKHEFNSEQTYHLENVILDGFETMAILGQISPGRKRYWYARLGKELGLKGLLPPRRWVKMHPFKVERLKRRIREDKALGLNTPVPLPPGQPITARTTKKGNMKTQLRVAK